MHISYMQYIPEKIEYCVGPGPANVSVYTVLLVLFVVPLDLFHYHSSNEAKN